MALRNFSFVINKRLAGCAYPGAWDSLEYDLDELRREGVTALVTLTEDALDAHVVRLAGLEYLHVPIEDFQAPSLAQIREFVDFARERIERPQGAVAVHCFAGRGRTGCMLACYLVADGLEAEDAISTVRRLRPGSLETYIQEQAVHIYQAWLQEMGMWRGAKAKAASDAAKPRMKSPSGKRKSTKARGGLARHGGEKARGEGKACGAEKNRDCPDDRSAAPNDSESHSKPSEPPQPGESPKTPGSNAWDYLP